MILKETSARKPSRIGFWIVLGLGVLLLPLAPRAARTEAPEEPQDGKTMSQPRSPELRFPEAPLVAKPVPVAHDVRNCSSCHSVPMPKFNFDGKPQSWREAHDEIVRLMDELRRRQAEFNKALNRPPQAATPDRSNEIETLQDAIELLKVQVRLKEARIVGTKATLDEYRRRLANYRALDKNQKGSVPITTIQEATLAVITQQAQLKVNEAELEEPRLRLKQAERRLARLQPPVFRSPVPVVPPKPQSPGRLEELEKKLDELRKEMDKLRRETLSKESRDPDLELPEAVGFIYKYWPIDGTRDLELHLPVARKAFQKCKAAGDRLSLQRLLTLTNGHADQLARSLAELHPELVIEDEKEAKRLKRVREQIVKLGQDIEDYLKAHLEGK